MTNDVPVFTSALNPQGGTEVTTALFREVFETEPDGAWYTPGRVNVIDEHTDCSGDLALPIVLPHRTHLALRRRENRVVRLVSSQTREEVDVMDLDTIGPKGTLGEVTYWASYIIGVTWPLEHDGLESLPGLGTALVSCVPLGDGLSSSATLECSITVAVDEVAHLSLTGTAQEPDDAGRAHLVTNCVRTENEMVGALTGGMDRSASMHCHEGHTLELDCRGGSMTHVPFSLATEGLALLVIDTKAKHSLDDGQYGARRAACERAVEIFGVELLADIAIEDLPGALKHLAAIDDDDADELVKRVRYVVTEIGRTRRLMALLQDGQPPRGKKLAEAGRLMGVSYESLHVDYKCTCPELDVAVEAAHAVGTHGARMTGDEFGGSTVALADADAVYDVARAMAEAYQRESLNPPASPGVVPVAPADGLA